ncbi:MAG: hypothetical protein WCS03_03880 [Bacteroidota bacterium]
MIDTSIEIQSIQREIIFQKTMKERFNIGAETINFGRALVVSNIRKTNPEISEIELKIALLKRYYKNNFSKKEFDLIIQSLIDYYAKNLTID